MKGKLLAIFVFLSGIATAQCDAGFTWSFDTQTNVLTCNATITNPSFTDMWNLSDTINFAGYLNDENIDVFTVAIPYGIFDFYILHRLSDVNGTVCSVIDTVHIDNTDGTKCDPTFLTHLNFVVPFTILYGVNDSDISHIWVIEDDTVSTSYNCTIDQQVNFSIQHIVYNNSGCYQELIDTVGVVTALSEKLFDTAIGTPYPNPNQGNIFIPVNAKKLQNLTFTVYNLLGQPVINQNNAVSAGNQTIQLPTESLAQGVYILQITDKKTGAVIAKKIVKD